MPLAETIVPLAETIVHTCEATMEATRSAAVEAPAPVETSAAALAMPSVGYRNRSETEQDFYVRARRDILRRVDCAWKIAGRKITLDQNVRLAKNVSIFFRDGKRGRR